MAHLALGEWWSGSPPSAQRCQSSPSLCDRLDGRAAAPRHRSRATLHHLLPQALAADGHQTLPIEQIVQVPGPRGDGDEASATLSESFLGSSATISRLRSSFGMKLAQSRQAGISYFTAKEL